MECRIERQASERRLDLECSGKQIDRLIFRVIDTGTYGCVRSLNYRNRLKTH
ncbi:hypothetical protein [Clostridium guangxiense]|uniref:hypothetical protein n=1 Tax=Clostridium guangxiense TaxID=1662055 RepID=UPI001E531E2D|nr:hypothetical protein [Clostridium guangxiense]MCD2347107.1 hypothetical protein [Clostridium guangxiense]